MNNNNRKDRWIMFCCFFFITSVVVGAISIPNQFNSGDPISSSQMNSNFSTIKGHIDGIEGVIDYSSSTAKINAGTTRIAAVATPTSGTDAATKDYVDSQVAASGGGGSKNILKMWGHTTCPSGYTSAYTGSIVLYNFNQTANTNPTNDNGFTCVKSPAVGTVGCTTYMRSLNASFCNALQMITTTSCAVCVEN